MRKISKNKKNKENKFIQPQMMAQDRYFVDRVNNVYTVDKYSYTPCLKIGHRK